MLKLGRYQPQKIQSSHLNKQRRFWATHVNRKWGLFSFNMPWCLWKICIAKFLFSDRDDLAENLGATTAHERQKVHFRLICVAHKRLCLSSLICLKGVVSYTQATVSQLHFLPVFFFFCLYCALSVLFMPLFYFLSAGFSGAKRVMRYKGNKYWVVLAPIWCLFCFCKGAKKRKEKSESCCRLCRCQ